MFLLLQKQSSAVCGFACPNVERFPRSTSRVSFFAAEFSSLFPPFPSSSCRRRQSTSTVACSFSSFSHPLDSPLGSSSPTLSAASKRHAFAARLPSSSFSHLVSYRFHLFTTIFTTPPLLAFSLSFSLLRLSRRFWEAASLDRLSGHSVRLPRHLSLRLAVAW